MARNIIFAIVGALLGAVILGAIVFFGGFLIANLIGDGAQALSIAVPTIGVPVALVIGAIVGARKGWRKGG